MRVFPASWVDRVRGYTSDDYVASVKEARTFGESRWYARWRQDILKVAVMLLVIGFFLFEKRVFLGTRLCSLFCFAVLLFSVVNFLQNIPSLDRFLTICYLFLFAFFFFMLALNSQEKWLSALYPVILLCVSIYLVVEIRIGLDSIGLRTLFTNPITVGLFRNDRALIDIFK
jgi:hypothetical protein